MVVDRSLSHQVSSTNHALSAATSRKVMTYGVRVWNVTGTVAVPPEVCAAPMSIGEYDWQRHIGFIAARITGS